MRVPVGTNTAAGGHGGTFGIGDPLVERPRRIFTVNCDLNCIARLDVPLVHQVEIWNVDCHQALVGEAGMLVGRRVFCERARLDDGFSQRRRTEIGSTRAALLLVLIDGDADAAVIRIFQALDAAEARGGAQPDVVARGDFRLVDALLPRFVDHE